MIDSILFLSQAVKPNWLLDLSGLVLSNSFGWPIYYPLHPDTSRAIFSPFARLWRTYTCCACAAGLLLGYIFEPRPNSRALGTAGSGPKITAGQRTMSGKNGVLTDQSFTDSYSWTSKQIFTCKSKFFSLCNNKITSTNRKLHKDEHVLPHILTGQKTRLDWAKTSLACHGVRPPS